MTKIISIILIGFSLSSCVVGTVLDTTASVVGSAISTTATIVEGTAGLVFDNDSDDDKDDNKN